MRRIAVGLTFAGMSLALSGCGGGVLGGALGYGSDPNRPVGDSANMQRALGMTTRETPLLTAPGNVWPKAMPAVPTLSDLEKQNGGAGGMGGTGMAPSAYPAPGGPATVPGAVPAGGAVAPASHGPGPRGAILIPNGNGTSTMILPDGSVKTVPTPKP